MDPARVNRPPFAGSLGVKHLLRLFLVFKPDTLLKPNTLISPEALDRYGHHLDGDQNRVAGDAFSMTFTTGPADLTPPRIVGASPKPNTQNVTPDAVLNFYYNEPIDSASVHEGRILLTASSQPTPVFGKVRNYLVDNRSVLSFSRRKFAGEHNL